MGAASDRKSSNHAEMREIDAILRGLDEERGTVSLPCPKDVDLIPLGRAVR